MSEVTQTTTAVTGDITQRLLLPRTSGIAWHEIVDMVKNILWQIGPKLLFSHVFFSDQDLLSWLFRIIWWRKNDCFSAFVAQKQERTNDAAAAINLRKTILRNGSLQKNCIQGSNIAAGKMFAIKKCNILSLRWAKSGPIKSPSCEINQHQNRVGVIAGSSMALEGIYKITRKSNSSLKMPSQKPI